MESSLSYLDMRRHFVGGKRGRASIFQARNMAKPGFTTKWWISKRKDQITCPADVRSINLWSYKLFDTKVLYICVSFCLLAHLTRDLSQAEKKINFVTSWANARNNNYFTQNCRSCHFERKKLSFCQLHSRIWKNCFSAYLSTGLKRKLLFITRRL